MSAFEPLVCLVPGGVRVVTYVRFQRVLDRDFVYSVLRRDNHRLLGHVYRRGDRWHAYVHVSAFRGAGIDDVGHVLDVVDPALWSFLDAQGVPEPTDEATTRRAAAEGLHRYLAVMAAPAVGFGRHPDVRVHTVKRGTR